MKKEGIFLPTPFLWIIFLSTLIIMLVGCVQSDSDKVHSYELIEQNPGGPTPSEAPNLRSPDNIVILQQEDEEEATDCFFEVKTFIRSEKGTNCDTYTAEIAGWSKRCVEECDSAARLDEVIASAKKTCAGFCKEKECPGPHFLSPLECAASDCYEDPDRCEDECPLMDYCFLLQWDRVYNCICVEA